MGKGACIPGVPGCPRPQPPGRKEGRGARTRAKDDSPDGVIARNYRGECEGGKNLNALAYQIEWGTGRRGDNDGAGRIHALFATVAAEIYKWERIGRLIRSWADPRGPSMARSYRIGNLGTPERKMNTRQSSIGTWHPPQSGNDAPDPHNAVAVSGLTSCADVSVDGHLAASESGRRRNNSPSLPSSDYPLSAYRHGSEGRERKARHRPK